MKGLWRGTAGGCDVFPSSARMEREVSRAQMKPIGIYAESVCRRLRWQRQRH